MLRQSSIWMMRMAVGAMVLCGTLLLLGLLLGRFWLGQHLDQYRPLIERKLSQEAAVQVQIAQLAVQWNVLLPRFVLRGLRVQDAAGRVDFSLREVTARPGVLSLLLGRLDFVELQIRQPELQVLRRQDGRLLVAGVLLPGPTDAPGSPFVDWLLNQRDIRIEDGHLDWQDLAAGTAPLALPHVNIHLQGQGAQHLLDLRADAPDGLARGLALRADVHAVDSQHLDDWRGSVGLRADFIDVGAMRHYVDLPAALRSGHGGFATDVQFSGQQVDGVQTDTRLEAVAVTLASDLPELRFDHLSGHLAFSRTADGFSLSARQLLAQSPTDPVGANVRPADVDIVTSASGGRASANVVNLGALAGLIESLPLPADLREAVRVRTPEGVVQGLQATWTGPLRAARRYALSARVADLSLRAVGDQPGVAHLSGTLQADQAGGNLAVDAHGFQLQLPQIFDQTLLLASVQAAAHWRVRGGVIECALDRLHLDDADLTGTVQGTLNLRDGHPQQALVHGTFERIEIGAVGRFLPLVVGRDARVWLHDALHGGTARQVTLALEGNLQDFPFARPASGTFHVHAPVDGVRLDFAPGWPALTGLRGVLDFDGPALRVQAQEAHQGSLLAHDVTGRIADLAADHPLLELQGVVSGPLQSGLQFILDSPLRATLGGFAGAVRAAGEGSLVLGLQVPLDNTDRTRVDGLLSVDQGELRDPARAVPPILAISTRLHFTEHEASATQLQARVLGGAARATLHTDSHGDVLVDVQGRADVHEAADFYGDGKLGFLQGQGDWTGKFHLGASATDVDVHAVLPLLGYPADLTVSRHGAGTLDVQASGHAPLPALLQTYAPALAPLAEGDVRWTAGLRRQQGIDELNGSGQFTLLGRPGEFQLGGRPGAAIVDFSGGLDTHVLARVLPEAAGAVLNGSTTWKARYDERPGQALGRFTSDLRGVRIELPAPVGKSANEGVPLRFQLQRVRNGALVLLGGIDRQLGVAVLLPVNPGEALRRIGIRLNGAASVPGTDGVQISGEWPALDLDAWQAALDVATAHARPTLAAAGAQPTVAAAAAQPAVAPAASLPVSADVHFASLHTGRYRFDRPAVQARSTPTGWHLEFKGPQLEGQADWSATGSGHLAARLDRLLLLAAGADPGVVTPVSALRDRTPGLDVEVRDLQWEGHPLGALSLRGAPEAAGWHLSALSLQQTGGLLTGEGHWLSQGGQNRTRINLQLKAEDTGGMLKAMGYPQALARGRTDLSAALDWAGDPQDFQITRLNGTLELDCRNGQFLTLEPGVGRLLGLLSLQALPRRVTLDFRDIFSQGFAFDQVHGHFDLKQGVLSTQNLEMQGPAARVALKGQAALGQETTDLDVRVSPAVGNGVAVASTVIGGPVAGAAAYALQKLLRDPIDQILAFEYRVTGSWDDPQVQPVQRNPDGGSPRPAGSMGK